ncbi:MAG: hypothetical protein HQL80_00510 [Magnetococcales bacterium]|nr:hypothetical protein [Magnetococcales bacterium]
MSGPRVVSQGRRREQGVALLLAMMAVLLAGFSLAVDALLVYGKRVREEKRAATALAMAKKSLIAYGVVQGGAAKALPCPFLGSVNDYGQAATATACGGSDTAVIGLLPWTTLQRPPLWDGEHAPIWYALSGNFKQGTTAATPAVCGAQVNGLTINGTGDYAAILFAPGGAVPGQSRDLSLAPPLQSAYLEEGNEIGPLDFVFKQATSSFNDQLLGITCGEIP